MNTEKQHGAPPPGFQGLEGQAGPGVYPNVPPPYEEYPQPYPQPMPPPQAPQVNVVQAPVMVAPPVGPQPSNTICPSCRAQIMTRITHNSSTKTHLIALLLCVIGCWPCCLIPYCTESCQNAEHYCPNCNAYIGTYSN